MPLQWFMATLSPCYRQGDKVYHNDNNSIIPNFWPPTLWEIPIYTPSHPAPSCQCRTTPYSTVQAKGCTLLLYLSSNTLQRHPASSHLLGVRKVSLSHLLRDCRRLTPASSTVYGERHYENVAFQKVSKPTHECTAKIHAAVIPVCMYKPRKPTTTLSEDIHTEPFWNWR